MPTQTTYELDIEVTRGSIIESRHRIHAAVVDADGSLVGSARDPEMVTFWRSCAKPFQVMPLLRSGGFDQVKWGADQLALACASHGGEREHVAIAQGMLASIGLEEGDLACGPHEPLSGRGARIVRESGCRLSRLHNNCSGKHAAMLAHAHTSGWPVFGYERDEHRVQRSILAEVARWTDASPERVALGVDGCGAVVFGLPLRAMALAWARLGAGAARGEEIPMRIIDAMATRPLLVGGTDRFDSVMIQETAGRVIAKVGAEGVHSVTIPEAGLGLAIKVEDGAQRAQHIAILRLLQMLDVLPDPLPPKLAELARRPVRNTRGEPVGEIRAVA